MIDRSKLAEIGVFNKPHGIKGEISASFDDDVLDLVEDFGHLFVELDGLKVPFSIISVRPKGSETLLLTLKGISDEKQAAKLSGLPVYIEKELLPESDEEEDDGFYLEDLIGFRLFDGDDLVGTIDGYDDSTENVLFEVSRNDGSVVLVPASAELFENVDVENARVVMNLPEGLLNL